MLLAAVIAAIPFDTLHSMQTFRPFQTPQLSPDAKRAAFTVCRSGEQCFVRVVELKTGRVTRVSPEGRNAWGPSWSRDGDKLAFFASAREGALHLYVANLQQSGSRDLGAAAPGFSSNTPVWLNRSTVLEAVPEATHAAPGSDPYRQATTTRGSTGTVYRSPADIVSETSGSHTPGSYALSIPAVRLTAVDVATGARRTILGAVELGPYALSPDGNEIAFAKYKGFAAHYSQITRWDVGIVSLSAAGDIAIVARNVAVAQGLSWSPSGRSFAWFARDSLRRTSIGVYDRRAGKLMMVSAPGNLTFLPTNVAPAWQDDRQLVAAVTRERIGNDIDPNSADSQVAFVDVAHARVRVPSSETHLAIQSFITNSLSNGICRNNSGVLFLAQDRRTWRDGIYRVDVDSGTVTALTQAQVYMSSPTCSEDGRVLLLVRESTDQPPDLWAVSAGAFGDMARVTELNPQLAAFSFGKAILVGYRGANGDELHAALLLPPGWSSGHRVPTIVVPYGSLAESQEIYGFGFNRAAAQWSNNMQIYATRGYAVMFPDVPLHGHNPMHDTAQSVLAAVRAGVKDGMVDSARLGIMGWSNGGYDVLALITQSNVFHAAVAGAGFSDWATLYSELEPDGSSHGISIGEEFDLGPGIDPWHGRQRYVDNSPFWLLDRVHTPLLLVHGANDQSVDPYNSAMTFVALRRLGRIVEFTRYAGEDHGFVSYQNQVDVVSRALAWFTRFLQG